MWATRSAGVIASSSRDLEQDIKEGRFRAEFFNWLNMLPIPVLDGGHILIMALEGIARRDFSIQVKEKMLLARFVVILMLMVTVIYNDLTRITWIERLMPWR